ncbi:MAG: hypothetical protein HY079_09830 [Elusimicrobia bacterium]|nr:hypothetical protein [Elusimicrobiota bacterium]
MGRPRPRDLALAAVLLAAALLRLPALRTELWLDEVWSLELARGAGSLRAVLFGIHHDNSTLLNTLWLWLVGPSASPALLRAASCAAGLLTVAVLAGDREDPARGRLTAALAAVSVPMVLYATEARGYAAMALVAVLCRRLLLEPGPPSRARAAAFAAVAALGLFAHPLSVCALAALAAWAAARAPARERLRTLAVLFGPAAALYAAYMLLQDGPTVFGAGAFNPYFPTLYRALASWSGAPTSGPWAAAGGAAAAALAGAELVRLARARDPEAVFFIVLFAANALCVAAFPFRYERHFFLSAPFALVLGARTLARMLRSGLPARAAAAALLALFVGGSAARLRELAAAGRGHYREALARMARDSDGPVVTVASDHDFRHRKMVEFYARAAAPAKAVRYVPGDGWKGAAPEWYLRHSYETDPRTAPVALAFAGGERFRLAGFFPYSGLSGWSLALYRRER